MRILVADSEIDFDALTVRRAGKMYPLPETAARLLRLLFDAEGGWVNINALLSVSGPDGCSEKIGTEIRDLCALLGSDAQSDRIAVNAAASAYRLKVPARVSSSRHPPGDDRVCVLLTPFHFIGGRFCGRCDAEWVSTLLEDSFGQQAHVRVLTGQAAGDQHPDRPEDTGHGQNAEAAFVIEGSLLCHDGGCRVTGRLVRAENSNILRTVQQDCPATAEGLQAALGDLVTEMLRDAVFEHHRIAVRV
ncbi:hypothetical protein [Roseobacter sp. S98]|uniref:hypothetical protein n=1 Tax=Roseobacter algicola (ex Choi et al. 2025) (nom. illeg.) TaxID=3092138 RepID=UPI003F50D8E8